ncbi:hypothetical protein D5086_000847 [Populus alba]|uniref:Uncharacterized protein n=1 Tax=Populus alba TaxID=43335 RepID=A0ACC4CX00_POPAL
MEVAATRQAGSVSKKLVEKGDKHSKKRILAAIWRGCLQVKLINWLDALGATLSTHVDKPGAYIGCLKSGEVFSEPTHKWYDPGWWKFGPFPVNMPVIDDVSTGSWFIGLQVHFAAPHGPQHFVFQGLVLSVESFHPEGSGIFPHGRRINNWSGAELRGFHVVHNSNGGKWKLVRVCCDFAFHSREIRFFHKKPVQIFNYFTDQRAATAVEVTKDRNGVDQVVLRNWRGASARVSLHGGQVLSWRTDQGEELLFTSSKAIFKPPNPVRGGIPICFPQFGNCGSLEQHGFARKKIWAIDQNPPPFLQHNDSNDKVYTDLLLKPSEEDLKIWPHSFEFRLRVCLTVEGNLTMISRIRNINCKPFSFSIAFHTYFSISDISEVRVEGLETLDYLDNLFQRERFTEQGDALTFESEVDRVYLSSSDVIAVFDHEQKRTFTIRKEGLPDVVVWNPWEKKSKSMVDFGDEEYKQMLCVDGAAIEKQVTLKPGEEWTGRLELSVVHSG